MVRAREPNPTRTVDVPVSPNLSIGSTPHHQLTLAIFEEIVAIGISGALVADDFDFTVASEEPVPLHDRLRLDVPPIPLVLPDLNRLASVPTRNFPEAVLDDAVVDGRLLSTDNHLNGPLLQMGELTSLNRIPSRRSLDGNRCALAP